MARKPSTMQWDGLKEFREELRRLPEDCRGEAAKVIEGHVNAAYVTVKRVYMAHWFTGTLATRLTIADMKGEGALAFGQVLKSGSPLAWLFDNGSQARHYTGTDKLGRVHVNAARGAMPGYHIFARTVGFAKRQIRQALKDMLVRRGANRVIDDGR
jgi:hypothetical protein